MNIIFLEPIYKDYIWGGYRLKNEFKKSSPYEKTAESWEISCNQNGICKIKNKEFIGKDLRQIYLDSNLKEDIFGINCNKYNEFPILIKFIDAMNNLSIQVHPDDDYAKKQGLSYGKNEMWYVIDAKDDSTLVAGINKNMSKKELQSIIERDKIQEHLNIIPVKTGDSIYIPAGTLHAIMSGLLICEIQQNSDITYRVYDWNRLDQDGKPRKLNKKEAIEIINTNYIPEIMHGTNEKIQVLTSNNLFKVEKIVCTDIFENKTNKDTFEAFCIVNGSGNINGVKIEKGDSFIVPACFGNYIFKGKLEMLRTTIK